uniref:Uncharacterized protein n=1 Tax=Anguilla anguilla TaxID=7936 RepID=A0A0E9QP85_ANGAN
MLSLIHHEGANTCMKYGLSWVTADALCITIHKPI